MTHKLKTETFSQKIEHSGGVIFFAPNPLFSCVTFHFKLLNGCSNVINLITYTLGKSSNPNFPEKGILY